MAPFESHAALPPLSHSSPAQIPPAGDEEENFKLLGGGGVQLWEH